MKRDHVILIALAVLTFASRAAFVYSDGTPEPDSVMMAAGMAFGLTGDVPAGDVFLYGRHVSPGLYFFVSAFSPILQIEVAHLGAWLTWLTVICSTVGVLLFHQLLRERLPAGVALGTSVVWALTPLVWESGTYFHPVTVAIALILAAVLCAQRATRGSAAGVLYFAGAVVFAAASFLVRIEAVFVWPALLLGVLLSRRPLRNAGILFVITGAVIGAHLGVQSLITADGAPVSGGPGVYLKWYRQSFAPAGLLRAGTWAILALGAGSIAAVLFSLLRGRAQVDRRLAVLGAALTLPCLLLWLPAPTPIMRHYFVASLGVAWLVGASGTLGRSPRRIVAATALLCIVNLGVPELLYAGYHALRPEDRKTPHGTFFSAHNGASGRLARLVALRRDAIACGVSDGAAPLRCIALANWEVSSHLLYELGIAGPALERIATAAVYPGAPMTRCALRGGGELRIVQYVYFADPALRKAVDAEIRSARREGFCAVVPEVLRDALPSLSEPGGPVIVYDLESVNP